MEVKPTPKMGQGDLLYSRKHSQHLLRGDDLGQGANSRSLPRELLLQDPEGSCEMQGEVQLKPQGAAGTHDPSLSAAGKGKKVPQCRKLRDQQDWAREVLGSLRVSGETEKLVVIPVLPPGPASAPAHRWGPPPAPPPPP